MSFVFRHDLELCVKNIPLIRSKPKQLYEKLNECLALIDKHGQDITRIQDTLLAAAQEYDALVRAIVLLPSITFFQTLRATKQSLSLLIRQLTKRIELLSNLAELLKKYPILNPRYPQSVDQLDEFYDEREVHHHKVMSLVEQYLPSSRFGAG